MGLDRDGLGSDSLVLAVDKVMGSTCPPKAEMVAVVSLLSAEQWEALDPALYKGYGYRELPCPLDGHIQAAIDSIKGADDFHTVVRFTRHDARLYFAEYPVRAGSLAVRLQDPKMVHRGLIACLLARQKSDDAVGLWYPQACLLYWTCEMLGLDAAQTFGDVAGHLAVPGELKQVLADFPQYSLGRRGLERGGYREGSDSNGFRFLSGGISHGGLTF